MLLKVYKGHYLVTLDKYGHIKTGEDKVGLNGNRKHGTKHNEYVCYECGATMDRDENAVANLLALLN